MEQIEIGVDSSIVFYLMTESSTHKDTHSKGIIADAAQEREVRTNGKSPTMYLLLSQFPSTVFTQISAANFIFIQKS